MDDSRTSLQEWTSRRVHAVRNAYSAFACMNEHGFGDMLVDITTSVQTICPFHGPDRNPSARFYPAGSGRSYDIVRCFKCKENWDCVNLYAKFKGLRFMDALQDLERRFRIRIPKRPEATEFIEPSERGSDYVSDKWNDVPRILSVLETKLSRMRDTAPLADYVRFCRVLDAIQWDLDKAGGKQNADMVRILAKLRDAMEETRDIASV